MPEVVGIERLIRSNLTTFNGYSARKSPETLTGELEVPLESVIKLDANENPYGCSPRVNQALATYPYLNIYPEADQTGLRTLLAGYTGAGAERIVASNGSNQLIDLILRLFVGPGDEVITCVPTLDLFRFPTGICRGRLRAKRVR